MSGGSFSSTSLPATRVVDAEHLELGLDVTGTDADDGAAAREVVEGLELLGRDSGWRYGRTYACDSRWCAGSAPASHDSVVMQSCQYVPIVDPSDSGIAMWSQTAT